jgi:AcrR family transcriptional regulator
MASGSGIPRSDVRANRQRLLDAARRTFASVGPTASLDEVAREAGVSRMTLYRHFATRDALAMGLYEQCVEDIEARAADAGPDPSALVDVYDQLLQAQVTDRAVAWAFTFAGDAAMRPLSDRLTAAFEPLLRRAIKAGTARSDVCVRDLLAGVFLFSSSHLSADPAQDDLHLVERARGILHRAFFTDAGSPLSASTWRRRGLDPRRPRTVRASTHS